MAELQYEEMPNEDEAEERGDVAGDSEISTASPDPYFFRTTSVDLEESPYHTQDPFVVESEAEQDENPIAQNTDSSSSDDGPNHRTNNPWQNDTIRLLPDNGRLAFRGIIPRLSFLDPSLLNNHTTETQPRGNWTETERPGQDTSDSPRNRTTDSQSEQVGDEESGSEPTSAEGSDEHWIPRLLMLPEHTSRALTRQLSSGEQRFTTTRAPWLLRDIFVYDSEGYDASDHSHSAEDRESSEVDENQFCEPITTAPEQEDTPNRCLQPDCLNRAAKECCNKRCGRCCRLNRNFCLRHGTESHIAQTDT